jgi:hypothetical protein
VSSAALGRGGWSCRQGKTSDGIGQSNTVHGSAAGTVQIHCVDDDKAMQVAWAMAGELHLGRRQLGRGCCVVTVRSPPGRSSEMGWAVPACQVRSDRRHVPCPCTLGITVLHMLSKYCTYCQILHIRHDRGRLSQKAHTSKKCLTILQGRGINMLFPSATHPVPTVPRAVRQLFCSTLPTSSDASRAR